MEKLASFETTRDGKPFGINISFEIVEKHIRLFLEINASQKAESQTTQIQLEVDTQNGLLTVNNLTGLSDLEICLAGCAVTSLVGPLIECFNKNPKKYIDCLKKKGISITTDIIECAIKCGLGV